MLTYNITNWVGTHTWNRNGAKPCELPHKAQKDGPEELPSGTQDLQSRQERKEKQEDQPQDGKTTWMSLWTKGLQMGKERKTVRETCYRWLKNPTFHNATTTNHLHIPPPTTTSSNSNSTSGRDCSNYITDSVQDSSDSISRSASSQVHPGGSDETRFRWLVGHVVGPRLEQGDLFSEHVRWDVSVEVHVKFTHDCAGYRREKHRIANCTGEDHCLSSCRVRLLSCFFSCHRWCWRFVRGLGVIGCLRHHDLKCVCEFSSLEEGAWVRTFRREVLCGLHGVMMLSLNWPAFRSVWLRPRLLSNMEMPDFDAPRLFHTQSSYGWSFLKSTGLRR